MKSIEDFEPFLIPYVPYAPGEVLQYAIRESIVEFMRETKIAHDEVSIETQEKVQDYLLEIPDCRRFLGVKAAKKSLIHCSGRVNWEPIYSGEDGQYKIELRKGDHPFLLMSEPEYKPHRIVIEYYWAISRDDCEVPDFIYEDFMHPIISGAIIRLAQMPQHEALAKMIQVHTMIWFDGVQKAKMEKTGGRPKRIISRPILPRRRGGPRWR